MCVLTKLKVLHPIMHQCQWCHLQNSVYLSIPSQYSCSYTLYNSVYLLSIFLWIKSFCSVHRLVFTRPLLVFLFGSTGFTPFLLFSFYRSQLHVCSRLVTGVCVSVWRHQSHGSWTPLCMCGNAGTTSRTRQSEHPSVSVYVCGSWVGLVSKNLIQTQIFMFTAIKISAIFYLWDW